MDIIVTVTDPEVIAEIESWENGGNYTLAVTQNTPLKMTATAAEEALPEEVEETEAEPAYPSEASQKSPGIAMMMSKEK